MLFYDEVEKLEAEGKVNTCLGNTTGRLRGDLLSSCCNCGLLIPTRRFAKETIVDEYHRGGFHRNCLGLWRNACPRCGADMLPNDVIPPPWDGMSSIKAWMTRKSPSPHWQPLLWEDEDGFPMLDVALEE